MKRKSGKHREGLSRREFLAYSAATGVALSVPVLWSGTGSTAGSPSAFSGPLVGPWRMFQFQNDNQGFLFSEQGQNFDYLPEAVVPGTVLTSLVANKKKVNPENDPSPYFGRNWSTFPDISPDLKNPFMVGPAGHRLSLKPPGNGNYTYWFLTKFSVPPNPWSDGRVTLTFRGINYSADLYLNKKKINPNLLEGAFLRQRLDVTDFVSIDRFNALAVKVNPPPLPGDPTSNHPGNFAVPGNSATITWPSVGQNGSDPDYGKETLGTVVTPQFSGGWDFVLSLADRNTGIWDDVLLAQTGPVRFLHDPQITTEIRWAGTAATDADVFANVAVSNDSASPYDVVVELEVMDGLTPLTARSQSMRLGAKVSSEIRTISVSLANPRLWWPNGHGPQPLYPTTIRIIVEEKVSDIYQCQTGVRLITSQMDPSGKTKGRVFTVNKRDIFIRGGVWTFPDAMLRHSAQDYDDQVHLHQLANLNLIRVWGGGILERPEFFDACDKYGLLVWQEFPDTADCGTATSTEIFLNNAADAIRMLRNHASLALWVGGNEAFPRGKFTVGGETSDVNVGLQVLIGVPDYKIPDKYDPEPTAPFDPSKLPMKLDPKTQYVGSSTSREGGFGGGDGPYGIFQPKQFFNKQLQNPFNPEYGSVGFPVLESLRRYMDAADYNDFGIVPLTQDTFDELNPGWFLHHFQPFFTGTDATPDQLLLYGVPANIEAFCEQAQAAQYQQYKALFEGLNAGMWQTYTGGNLWRSQCGWTGLKGFLYDYYLEPTAGLFGARIAGAAISVHINLDNYEVTIVNNTAIELPEGLTVEVSLCDEQGKLKKPPEPFISTGPVPASGIKVVGSLNDVIDIKTLQIVRTTLKSPPPESGVMATNLDWIADTSQLGSYAPLRALPRVVLDVDPPAQGQLVNGFGIAAIELHNRTDTLAFFNRIRVWQPDRQTLVAPVFLSDNYFALLPGEQVSLTVKFRTAPMVNLPTITLTGWNSGLRTDGNVVPVNWPRR
jgi:mannosylglycoprotein endo-beta-mannosidase